MSPPLGTNVREKYRDSSFPHAEFNRNVFCFYLINFNAGDFNSGDFVSNNTFNNTLTVQMIIHWLLNYQEPLDGTNWIPLPNLRHDVKIFYPTNFFVL